MATYPHCRECGADLTSQEEQQEGLCVEHLKLAIAENEPGQSREGEADGLE